MEYKYLFAALTTALTFLGYFPYIFDIIKNKTQPHVFTWFTATVTSFIAYKLQVLGQAGIGAVPMLVVCLICLVVTALSVWKGTRDITVFDVVVFLLALLSIVLWVFVDKPIESVITLTCAEILGFIPTLRKSWKFPYSETLSLYTISMIRHGIALLALEQFNLLTVLYSASWSLVNVVIVAVLIFRRKTL